MPYITKSDVATYLQVTLTTAQQAAVDAIIPGVEKAAEVLCFAYTSSTVTLSRPT